MLSNCTLEITCPSGLAGRIRGMTVKDEEILLDPKIKKTGDPLGHLISTCWTETTDPGPYKTLSWGKAVSADRTYALLQLRIASFGEDYSFPVICENCSHQFGWGVNLNELDVTPITPEGIAYLTNGAPIDVVLSSGDVVKTKLLTGLDEKFIQSLNPKDRPKLLTYNLARSIVEINGKTSWRDIIAEVEELPSRYSGELWNEIDRHAGGVDTTFSVECEKCDREQQVTLPFTAGFLSNRKQFASSKIEKTG